LKRWDFDSKTPHFDNSIFTNGQAFAVRAWDCPSLAIFIEFLMQLGDKRKNPRRWVSYPAFIDLGGDQAPIECMLCEASQEGAQLAVAEPNSLPNEFILALSCDGAVRRRCRMVWRTDARVGVEYLENLNSTRSTRHPLMHFTTSEQATTAPDQAVTPEQPEASAEPADQVDIDTLLAR
jgi:hypothetical protein